jgi:hypothetical protein
MNDYTCPMVSTLGILEPMDPTQQRQYNSYVGPMVTSDWDVPVHDMGVNYQVSSPVSSVRTLGGLPEAMKVFDAVNFLFPV